MWFLCKKSFFGPFCSIFPDIVWNTLLVLSSMNRALPLNYLCCLWMPTGGKVLPLPNSNKGWCWPISGGLSRPRTRVHCFQRRTHRLGKQSWNKSGMPRMSYAGKVNFSALARLINGVRHLAAHRMKFSLCLHIRRPKKACTQFPRCIENKSLRTWTAKFSAHLA